MSSSQPPSNNNNPNQFSDYENDESLNPPRYPQQSMPGHLVDNRTPSDGNDVFDDMYPFQDEIDEGLTNDIVTGFDTKAPPIQSKKNDEDDSVFSDVVQDAFKKYQNEYSQYWTYNDTIWDNRYSDEELSDDEQEELYAQMEECWNYMAQETSLPDPAKTLIGQCQLNPDAIEFKPSWLQSAPISTSEALPNTSTSSQAEDQQKKF